jgi:hypothetical protein
LTQLIDTAQSYTASVYTLIKPYAIKALQNKAVKHIGGYALLTGFVFSVIVPFASFLLGLQVGLVLGAYNYLTKD